MEKLIHGTQVWALNNPRASIRTHIQSHFLITFGAILLEAKTLGCVHLKTT